MYKSANAKDFKAMKIEVSPVLTMGVDPIGTVSLYFSDATFKVVEKKGSYPRLGTLDMIHAFEDGTAYAPLNEAATLIQKGYTELAAITMVFLRACLVMQKKAAVLRSHVQNVPKLLKILEISPKTAEMIITHANFWYAANAWVLRYATDWVTESSSGRMALDELVVPFVIQLYSEDANLCIALSKFVESEMFAPFHKDTLCLIFSRDILKVKCLVSKETYMDAFSSELAKDLYDIALAYALLKRLVRELDLATHMPAATIVLKQLLYAYEAVLSCTVDKIPVVTMKQLPAIVDLAEVPRCEACSRKVLCVLKGFNNRTIRKLDKTFLKDSFATLKANKELISACKSIHSGKVPEAFHELLGEVSKIVRLRLV